VSKRESSSLDHTWLIVAIVLGGVLMGAAVVVSAVNL